MNKHASSPQTVSAICDTLGRKAIADRLGVGTTAVSNASVDGRFPAAWYLGIVSMCDAAGLHCPIMLFNWRGQDRPRGQHAENSE